MTLPKPHPDMFAFEPGWLAIALFSQPDCKFCEVVREHCLEPLMATRPRRIAAAEFRLSGSRRNSAWAQAKPTEAEFARERKARFAPTLMCFGPA